MELPEHLRSIRRIASCALVLFSVLMLIDRPVTITGIILSIVIIAALLFIIVFLTQSLTLLSTKEHNG